MKNVYIFDCEGNGLTPDKFHCMVYSKPDGNKGIELTSHEDMRKFLLSADVLIGHNIILWDIPNLERVLGIKVKAKLIDTLALSWYLYPERIRHGLADWGEEFGTDRRRVCLQV